MKKHERAILLEVLGIQSKSRQCGDMIAYMNDALTARGMDVVEVEGQLLARKGNRDVAVPYYVAHADTVHDIVPPEHYSVSGLMHFDTGDIEYYAYDPTTKERRGVGGDDKCGLFVTLMAAEHFADVGVIITTDEEIGCVGARKLREGDCENAAILIQADRRGNRDAVRRIWETISSLEWQDHVDEALREFGYLWCENGMITDVGELSETFGLSAVNLSAGYHAPHTRNEYISEAALENCTALALRLGELSMGQVWRHELPRRDTWSPKFSAKKAGVAYPKEKEGKLSKEYAEHYFKVDGIEIVIPRYAPENWAFTDENHYMTKGEGELRRWDAIAVDIWENRIYPQYIATDTTPPSGAYLGWEEAWVESGDIDDIEDAEYRSLDDAWESETRYGPECWHEGCYEPYYLTDVESGRPYCLGHLREYEFSIGTLATLEHQIREFAETQAPQPSAPRKGRQRKKTSKEQQQAHTVKVKPKASPVSTPEASLPIALPPGTRLDA